MMKARGHHVTLYAGEQNEAPCDEHVQCIGEAARAAMVGVRHYTEANWNHPGWRAFNAAVIAAMAKRIEPRDFICLIGGRAHKPIADAFPALLAVAEVESGGKAFATVDGRPEPLIRFEGHYFDRRLSGLTTRKD